MKYNKTKTIEEYVAHLQLMVDDLNAVVTGQNTDCLLYTSPSPRD